MNVVHPPREGDQDSSEKAIRIHRKGESQITSKHGHYLTFFPRRTLDPDKEDIGKKIEQAIQQEQALAKGQMAVTE